MFFLLFARPITIINSLYVHPNINRGTYVPASVWHTVAAKPRAAKPRAEKPRPTRRSRRPRGQAAALRARGEAARGAAASCRGKAARGEAAYNLVFVKLSILIIFPLIVSNVYRLITNLVYRKMPP